MITDVQFRGGLYTALSPASAPDGTLAECNNADVTDGAIRCRPGIVLLGTPSNLAANPTVYAMGWGQYKDTQEIVWAVSNNVATISVYKWSPGDASPVELGQVDGDTVAISQGAIGKHIYVAVTKTEKVAWYRHEIGKVPPDTEAFAQLKFTSDVSPPTGIDYQWYSSLPSYKAFGSAADGSSVLYSATGTSPSSVNLFSTYVKVVYPTSTEPGSTLTVTVSLGASKQFNFQYNDALAMQFLVRNCTLDVRRIEFETSTGGIFTGMPWGATAGGGYVGTSWVLFPVQQERRADRDTEKVVKVRIVFAVATAVSSATPEIWIDSPFLGGTYLWEDPWMSVADQPMKYAAQFVDNTGKPTDIGAITEVPDPEAGTWESSIGGHLILTPVPSNDAKMSSGNIKLFRALRFPGEREERWFHFATISNNPSTPQSATDKYLPREHARNDEVGVAITSLPGDGTVYAIKPHQERLFIALNDEIWASMMGNPEKHVVDPGFDPLAPTAPEKHYASANRASRVTGFASGDAMLVCTTNGSFIEFGWPDQLSYQRVKVFDEPSTSNIPAAEGMGASVFTSPMGLYGVSPSGQVQEISQNIRRDLSAYSPAWYRGEVYLVSGNSMLWVSRAGSWHEATLGVSLYALYGGFSNLAYIPGVGTDGKLYAIDWSATTDNGSPITWRVATNYVKVADGEPFEVRIFYTGTAPTVKVKVPGRSETVVPIHQYAGFTVTDTSNLGVQFIIEGAQDTVVEVLQIAWEESDRVMRD